MSLAVVSSRYSLWPIERMFHMQKSSNVLFASIVFIYYSIVWILKLHFDIFRISYESHYDHFIRLIYASSPLWFRASTHHASYGSHAQVNIKHCDTNSNEWIESYFVFSFSFNYYYYFYSLSFFTIYKYNVNIVRS